MPFGPAVSVGHAVRRKMKVVDFMSELRHGGSDPSPIAIIVLPGPIDYLGRSANRFRRRRDLAAGMNGILPAVRRAHVEKASLDLWRHRRYLPRETGGCEKLSIQ